MGRGMRAFALAAAGYLPKKEFQAQLEMGLARIAFKAMQWQDAERIYREVVAKHPYTFSAAEARYGRAVSHNKPTITRCWDRWQRSCGRTSQTASGRRRLPWLGE